MNPDATIPDLPQLPSSGEVDTAAVTMHEFYTAYRKAGFTESEALALIQTMIAAGVHAERTKPGH